MMTAAAITVATIALAQQSASSDASSQPFRPPMSAEEMIVEPSPEVGTMPPARVAEVDLASGQASLSVPLLQWQVGSTAVGVGLSYSVGALPAEAEPGWIAMGWNLQGAGAVTRSVAGLPDEYKSFDLRSADNADPDYIEDLLKYHCDASLDRYNYYCPGGSGQFVVRPSGEICQLPVTNNRIELIGDKSEGVRDFRVTTPDGTRYEFTEREHVDYCYLPGNADCGFHTPAYSAVSTWHLSRIITPEGADTIRYDYDAHPLINRNHNRASATLTVRNDPWGDMTPENNKISFLTANVTPDVSVNSSSFHDSKILKRISSRTGSAEFDYESPRPAEKFICRATLRDHTGAVVRKAELKANAVSGRRKLNEIIITDVDDVLIDRMEMTYHDDNAHPIGDFFGFANALSSEATTATQLLDEQTLKVNPRRKPNPQRALAGALKSTLSATGVLTEYAYEANTIPLLQPSSPARAQRLGGEILLPSDSLVTEPEPFFPIDSIIPPTTDPADTTVTIGLRLRSITQTDRITGRKVKREFSYSDGMTNVDFSRLSLSDFITISGMRWFYIPQKLWGAVVTVEDTSSSLLFGSRSPGYRPESARIFYRKVTESVSGTGIDHPIMTDYEFDLSRCPLEFIEGGHEMDDNTYADDSLSLLTVLPTSASEAQRRRFGGHRVRGFFREHIGAQPELHRRTLYRFQSGQYTPAQTETYSYITADSLCITSGLHYEPLVRQVRTYPQEVVKNQFSSMADISCFNISVEASTRVTDAVTTVNYFPDGSRRSRSTNYSYVGLRIRDGGQPRYSLRLDTTVVNPGGGLELGGGLIGESSSLLLPVGETVSEGGHSISRSMIYSDMMADSEFYRDACSRGLHTLPVSEQWVIDDADTLTRRYSYGLFPGINGAITRPATITTAVNSVVTETVSITAYSPFGRPAAISRTGRPATIASWGYGGDMLTQLTTADRLVNPTISLSTDYEYQPLTGCTKITSPSGRSRSFDYSGGRLSRIADSSGQTLTQYLYEFFGMTPGQFAGRNVISTASWVDPQRMSVASVHFDGFGSEVAAVSEGLGGDGSDVATLTRRDALSRPVASWVAMPLSANQVSDAMKRDVPLLAAGRSEFDDAAPYSAMTYPEGEATDMPLSATIAGEEFADHPALSQTTCSNPSYGERRVVRWRWDGASLSADGFYTAGELDAVRSVDGDGRVSLVFTDCMGRTVLQRAVADGGRYADTYTICDRWGNPLLVIPPEASERLGSSGSLSIGSEAVNTLLNDYAFIYRYDRRLRLRSKKLPGCAEVRFAYDSENRLAFTRDGNQAQQGRRSFMLYDPLGRPAVTGTCRDALSESFWSDNAPDSPAMTASASTSVGSPSSLCSSGYQAADSVASLLIDPQLLTATFYDSYTPVATRLSVRPPAGVCTSPKGLATATLTAVLGPGADSIPPLLSVTFYDTDERPVMTVSDTHLDQQLQTLTAYNRAGQPTSVGSALLSDPTHPQLMLTCNTAYDNHGRPTDATLNYAGRTFNLGSTAYDRLGRTASVTAHGDITRTLTYDLHGWITAWSCRTISQSLSYASGTNPSYTGRISQKTTSAGATDDTYIYSYDMLGRLTSATFRRLEPNSLLGQKVLSLANYSTSYTYDLQGNMLTLKRQGPVTPKTYGMVDNIAATYSGNQIASLRDDAPSVLLESSLDMASGSWSGSDFAYDRNGNQTRDMSRGVADIDYNPLNLPRLIEMASGGTIEYLYAADGTKLAEIVRDSNGALTKRRDYAGIFEFENGEMKNISLASGYLTPADTTYHIYVSDHQGNIVAVYNTRSGLQEQYTSFYPYGLPQAQISTSSSLLRPLSAGSDQNSTLSLSPGGDIIISPTPTLPDFTSAPCTNRRLYSAKELTTDHGLNAYDFEARWLTPAFPRFTTPDPLAEKYKNLSIYIYCGDDPINLIDPTGMEFTKTAQDWVDKLTSFAKERIEKIDSKIKQKEEKLKSEGISEKKAKKISKQIESLTNKKDEYNAMLQEFDIMSNSSQVYDVVKSSEYGNSKGTTRYNSSNGNIEIVLPYGTTLDLAAHELKHGFQFEMGTYGITKHQNGEPLYDYTDEEEAYKRSTLISGENYSDILENYNHLQEGPCSLQSWLHESVLNSPEALQKLAIKTKSIFRWNGKTYVGITE